MIYPKFLQKNGKISFIAPSLGCTTEPYETRLINAKKVLESIGHTVECGPNCFTNLKALSNTKELCAKEVNDYFSDNTTDIIISVGGGELMCEIVPYIDFNILKKNPKWFMGFSDNTNLTFLLTTICDIASIYGPCAGQFGITPWHDSITDGYKLLTGEKLTVKGYGKWEKEWKESDDPLEGLNLTEDTIITAFPKNFTIEGRLLGGCLDVLLLTLGTKFDHVKEFAEKYQNDGIIWYLEACDLNVMAIRRAFYQLDQAGWFKYVKGFIIGRALNGENAILDIDHIEAVYDVIKKYNVPCVFDVDLGHFAPSMPIINGSYGKVVVKDNDIEIKMELK